MEHAFISRQFALYFSILLSLSKIWLWMRQSKKYNQLYELKIFNENLRHSHVKCFIWFIKSDFISECYLQRKFPSKVKSIDFYWSSCFVVKDQTRHLDSRKSQEFRKYLQTLKFKRKIHFFGYSDDNCRILDKLKIKHPFTCHFQLNHQDIGEASISALLRLLKFMSFQDNPIFLHYFTDSITGLITLNPIVN